MLEQVLKAVIPSQLQVFPKLTPDRDPYYFSSWDLEETTGEPILRYWFWSRDGVRKHRKRVFVREAEHLLKNAIGTGRITKCDFEKYCPRTNGDGGCGFAVIIAILKHFGAVRRSAWGVYAIVDRDRAREMAGD
jgi:hypothetical protein